MENLGTRALTDNLDRVYFYTNISSCILAKTRCSQYNPISGEFQNTFGTPVNTAATVWLGGSLPLKQLTSFNALHISETGDLRVITFPAITTAAADQFCSRRPILQQTGYGAFVCIVVFILYV
uniref:O-acetyl-ADP-ribose deacetylase n=1 Tax=Zeugodacus cucurbitae TaxID=28588 RepID=A0A0A1WIZ8_ZEUCU